MGELSNGAEQPPKPPRRPMAPRNTSGSIAAAVAAAAVVAGASAQSWSIPTFPGMAAMPTFPAGGFTMPTFSGVPGHPVLDGRVHDRDGDRDGDPLHPLRARLRRVLLPHPQPELHHARHRRHA